ncbi:MAG TPA: SDR family NAD(P)-dependent oxidoreductase [Polyangiaceae bacterium]|nr:SDR family NAD(P)-dependent oxidoreductase [Polyangiaceae bacterium]
MLLANKTVLITGGTAGIGVALARVLKGRGAKILVCGRDRERLEALARENFFTIRADVGTDEGRAAIIDAGRRLGGFDVLVNNAGIQSSIDFRKEVPLEQARAELDTNLAGPILLTALAMPHLLDRPEAYVVNVTSALALVPKRTAPVYCATKAGLRSFSTALRYQLEGTSVRVLEVVPPLVDTKMAAGRGGTKISPLACAEAIVRGLEGDREVLWIGRSRLLYRVHRVAPSLAARLTKNA